MYVHAIDDAAWRGPVNAAAPEPVTNAEFSKALGRVLRRPAVAPVPALAIKALYGQMAEIVLEGQRAVPERATALGYAFRHPDLEAALRDALGK
jgi:NAD dependent epimerase/dehydratase family enzyme